MISRPWSEARYLSSLSSASSAESAAASSSRSRFCSASRRAARSALARAFASGLRPRRGRTHAGLPAPPAVNQSAHDAAQRTGAGNQPRHPQNTHTTKTAHATRLRPARARLERERRRRDDPVGGRRERELELHLELVSGPSPSSRLSAGCRMLTAADPPLTLEQKLNNSLVWTGGEGYGGPLDATYELPYSTQSDEKAGDIIAIFFCPPSAKRATSSTVYGWSHFSGPNLD